jgi:hypothetical protein
MKPAESAFIQTVQLYKSPLSALTGRGRRSVRDSRRVARLAVLGEAGHTAYLVLQMFTLMVVRSARSLPLREKSRDLGWRLRHARRGLPEAATTFSPCRSSVKGPNTRYSVRPRTTPKPGVGANPSNQRSAAADPAFTPGRPHQPGTLVVPPLKALCLIGWTDRHTHAAAAPAAADPAGIRPLSFFSQGVNSAPSGISPWSR